MLEFSSDQQSQIAKLCRQYQVRSLEVFGSAARSDFGPTSDVDFFVEFEPVGATGAFKRYMGLKLALEDLLGRSVDLVERNAVTNEHFLLLAEKSRRSVYAA